jgi:hypothetical protein
VLNAGLRYRSFTSLAKSKWVNTLGATAPSILETTRSESKSAVVIPLLKTLEGFLTALTLSEGGYSF